MWLGREAGWEGPALMQQRHMTAVAATAITELHQAAFAAVRWLPLSSRQRDSTAASPWSRLRMGACLRSTWLNNWVILYLQEKCLSSLYTGPLLWLPPLPSLIYWSYFPPFFFFSLLLFSLFTSQICAASPALMMLCSGAQCVPRLC